uniref:Uncharacterized protein n=1 Tax=viral metagenome TaxID=1070528 RepID=A0A6C0C070_9ZZZZ
MITADTAQILKAYTTLRDNVQGSLVKRARGFELWGNIQRVSSSSDSSEVWTKAHAVHCILRATFYDDLNSPGTLKEGPFVIQGDSLQTEGKRIVLGRVLQSSDTETSYVNKLALVSFLEKDILKCSSTEEIPFATTNTSSPNAPPWSYIEPVFAGKFNKAIVACAGGCFVIAALNTPTVQPQYAKDLLSNLVNIDIVAFAPGTPAVIYRLARNAVLVAPADFEDKLQDLQMRLQLPTSTLFRHRLPSEGDWQISASMADSDMLSGGVSASISQIRDNAPDIAVYAQPLVGWQLPERRLVLYINCRYASITDVTPGKGIKTNLQPWMAKGHRMGVQTVVDTDKFSPLKPGETAIGQKERLGNIIRETSQASLVLLSVEGGKKSLDAVTRQLADALTTAMNESGLFSGTVTVQVNADLVITKGETVRLHSGSTVMLPEYACSASSARMACLASMIAAGLKLTFIPWSRTKQGFALS